MINGVTANEAASTLSKRLYDRGSNSSLSSTNYDFPNYYINDYDPIVGMESAADRAFRNPAPRLIFLFATIILTVAGTAFLCGAIMTDHWEEVYWNRQDLDKMNITPIQWYLDGKVAKLHSRPRHPGNYPSDRTGVVVGFNDNNNNNNNNNRHAYIKSEAVTMTGNAINDKILKDVQAHSFLVPMHGGIWTLCVSLTDEEIESLAKIDFPQERCINYLSPDAPHQELRTAWQNRMQNLSISCSLVCLIILGSAVIVGLFGLCRHQISAILVTGVMYLLAAIFALFTLMILYNKRSQERSNHHHGRAILDGPEDGVVGGPVDRAILKARRFAYSWSIDFGWGGVTLSALASIAWMMLSKIMRFSPIALLIA